MDTVPFGEDIRLHRRVPFVGAMPKMYTALEKRFHGNDRHSKLSFAFVLRFLHSRPAPVPGTPRLVGKRV
jgi:hypothetical protein